MHKKKTAVKRSRQGGRRSWGILEKLLLFFGAWGERMPESGIGKVLSGLFSRFNLYKGVIHPTRRRISAEIEQSAILGFIESFFDKLLYMPLRGYGTLMITYTVYTVLISVFKMYFATGQWVSVSLFAEGITAILLSLVLLLASSKKTLASALIESKILSYVCFDMLGIRKQPFERDKRSETSMLAVFLIGSALSLLTLVWSTRTIAFAVLWILFLRVTMVGPESGLLLSMFLLPLLPMQTVAVMVLCSGLSYVMKLLRGKRNLKMNFYMLVTLLFAVSVLVSGWIRTAGDGGREAGNMLILLLMFFLVCQLFSQREWIGRGASVVGLAVVITAVRGTVLFALGYLPEKITGIFTFLPKDEYLLSFDSPEFYGLFLAIGAAVYLVRLNNRIKIKAWGIAFFLVLVAGVAVSHSPMAWIVAIFGVLFLLVLYKNVFLLPSLLVSAAAFCCTLFLPENVMAQLSSFSAGFSASAKGVWNELLSGAERGFFGIGSGGAAEGGNSFTHVLTVWGFMGVFFISVMVIGGFAFGFYAALKNEQTSPQLKWILCGYEAALASVLVAGIGSDIWQSNTVLYLFFFLMGMTFATGRVLLKEGEQQMRSSELDRDYLFIPVLKKEKNAGILGKKSRKAVKVPADPNEKTDMDERPDMDGKEDEV